MSWSELVRRTFGFEIVCQKCQFPLRLIALIKSEDVANRILTVMHPPVDMSLRLVVETRLSPRESCPRSAGEGGRIEVAKVDATLVIGA